MDERALARMVIGAKAVAFTWHKAGFSLVGNARICTPSGISDLALGRLHGELIFRGDAGPVQRVFEKKPADRDGNRAVFK